MNGWSKIAGVLTVALGWALAGLAPRLAPATPSPSGFPSDPRVSLFIRSGPVAEDWSERALPGLLASRSPMDRDEARAMLDSIEHSASRFGLDPTAVLAVIEVESRFDPRAVSRRGALGLMQLKTLTAREVAAELGIPWSSDDLLFDPHVNVLLGTCYLRRLLDRFGDLDAALAAFNAGPSRIQGRIARSQGFSFRYADRILDALFEHRSRALA